MNFYRHHVIITGGSSGIGLATARLLARAGASLSIIARDPAKLAAAKAALEAECLQQDQRVIALSADVADRQQAQQAVSQAMSELGPPDLLIVSAGIVEAGRFQELADDAFERTMATNYLGNVYVVRAAIAAMAQRKRGHIVFISSLAGLIGIYGYSAYSPTKFAVDGLAEALRMELKPLNIHVSIAYPPDTDTPQLAEELKTRPRETTMIAQDPLIGSKAWQAEDVARLIVRGIARRTFLITPGLEYTLLIRLYKLIKLPLFWYMDRIVARATRQAARQGEERPA